MSLKLNMRRFIVITTINEKSEAVKKFSKFKGWEVILVGDKKSHKIKNKNNITFLSVEDQRKLGFEIFKHCPYNSYSRKNIGYLYAMKLGADVIYDTDDDNLPYSHWAFPDFHIDRYANCNKSFVNIYQYFTSEKIWPRGYPLDEINTPQKISIKKSRKLKVGLWQGMVDIDPDVDAIYRLAIGKKIRFCKKNPIVLNKRLYCPLNSQNTLWSQEVFSCLYLPVSVSFRFTDILRGYIAQRLFWENDYRVGFTGATVYQNRNKHNLMKDFEDEMCYIHIKDIVEILERQKLTSDVWENMLKIYKALRKKNYVKDSELDSVKAWAKDMNKVTQ